MRTCSHAHTHARAHRIWESNTESRSESAAPAPAPRALQGQEDLEDLLPQPVKASHTAACHASSLAATGTEDVQLRRLPGCSIDFVVAGSEGGGGDGRGVSFGIAVSEGGQGEDGDANGAGEGEEGCKSGEKSRRKLLSKAGSKAKTIKQEQKVRSTSASACVGELVVMYIGGRDPRHSYGTPTAKCVPDAIRLAHYLIMKKVVKL